MFEWLEEIIAQVNTRKFFLVHRPSEQELAALKAGETVVFPPSYNEFRRKFGRVRLYKSTGLSYYHVGVESLPERCLSPSGEAYYRFGWHSDCYYYFKESLLQGAPASESPIFAGIGQRLVAVRPGFGDWLKDVCEESRERYSSSEWRDICNGPTAFNQLELEIVEARKTFRWELVGTTPEGKLKFRIYNGSNMVLHYLSLGVRTGDRRLNGGIWIDVSSLAPGREAIFERVCYEGLIDAAELEVFNLPDPQPEDRPRYWEFRDLP